MHDELEGREDGKGLLGSADEDEGSSGADEAEVSLEGPGEERRVSSSASKRKRGRNAHLLVVGGGDNEVERAGVGLEVLSTSRVGSNEAVGAHLQTKEDQ